MDNVLRNSAVIERPKTCGDCYCWQHDNDRGGFCKYSLEEIQGDTPVIPEAIGHKNCIFKDIYEI